MHDLGFDLTGCPVIPVTIQGKEFPFKFDTGSNSGLLLTSLLEKQIEYALLGQTEALNRDDSHRGWLKTIRLNEFSVFGKNYTDVETHLANWEMYSSEKFNGLIGLEYFPSQVITLDYAGKKIAVTSHPIDYGKLDIKKYAVLPLLKTKEDGQSNLPFFEAVLNGGAITVYLDTGKNYSYLHNPASAYSPGPGNWNAPNRDVTIKMNGMELPLKGITEVNLAQVADLPHPVAIELNSDQIQKNNMLITVDNIRQCIIFRK